ncbi:MAG: cyclomaltodextrinase N-terminal domain-containing protein, partial [Chitinophagaceae bacterium]
MMTKGKMLLFISLLFASLNALAQNIQLYPTNWWVNMKWNKVQILVHTTDSSFNKSKVTVQYPGVKITKIHQLDNPKFLAVDVTIAPGTKPGNVALRFANNGKTNSVNWPLKARRTGAYAQGVTSKDLVYLIMPDRFSNGDPSNDRIPGLRDQSLNRDSIYHRHGGDLQGIINHLDYLQSLGGSKIALNPGFM